MDIQESHGTLLELLVVVWFLVRFRCCCYFLVAGGDDDGWEGLCYESYSILALCD